ASNNKPVSLASCNVLAGLTKDLPANQIPAGCQTSGAGFWPTSASNSILNLPSTTGNFFSPSSEFGYSYNGVARLDHQFSDKHHLSLRAIGRQPGAGHCQLELGLLLRSGAFARWQLRGGAQLHAVSEVDKSIPFWRELLQPALPRQQQQF